MDALSGIPVVRERQSLGRSLGVFLPAQEVKCQVGADKATKADLKDSFRAWTNICDEAEVILEQQRFQEDEVKPCIELPMETWEATENKVEAVNEKSVDVIPKQ